MKFSDYNDSVYNEIKKISFKQFIGPFLWVFILWIAFGFLLEGINQIEEYILYFFQAFFFGLMYSGLLIFITRRTNIRRYNVVTYLVQEIHGEDAVMIPTITKKSGSVLFRNMIIKTNNGIVIEFFQIGLRGKIRKHFTLEADKVAKSSYAFSRGKNDYILFFELSNGHLHTEEVLPGDDILPFIEEYFEDYLAMDNVEVNENEVIDVLPEDTDK